MSDEVYCYPPDFTVLKNRFEIRDPDVLERAERSAVQHRISEGCPKGDFDLKHLKAIHKHLFQDVYDWAGEIRTVEIIKGKNQFQFRQYIETGMADVHRRIVAADYLKSLSAAEFAKQAGALLGDVNYVHPFREGNGRVQLQYLKQLAETASHSIDLTQLNRDDWIEASIAAHNANYRPMSTSILRAISNDHDRSRETGRER